MVSTRPLIIILTLLMAFSAPLVTFANNDSSYDDGPVDAQFVNKKSKSWSDFKMLKTSPGKALVEAYKPKQKVSSQKKTLPSRKTANEKRAKKGKIHWH